MVKPADTIRFKAALLQPAAPADATWLFLQLPATASNKLPSRSMVTTAGTFAGHPVQATLQPDGQGGHWLKVDRALQRAAGVAAGETVALDIAPVAEEPEPVLPDDLHAALAAQPNARATWDAITAVARRDWIFWVTSGKKADTRIKRIATACDMLASGKRRACCFDRSGMYGKSLAAPTPKAG
ncbi:MULTISPECIES: YdeI/OmpD-associated family protein [unclassified Xanthomonas]|uniref:YdeI/OmpD-associated family protein n=1 Tax=unclassified Xanthomonas TaxID=2643310 RepID=UPI00288322ED|nr:MULTISPECIES: YdeI/OmpD-associated family protein [unclassified Xanthomonas]